LARRDRPVKRGRVVGGHPIDELDALVRSHVVCRPRDTCTPSGESATSETGRNNEGDAADDRHRADSDRRPRAGRSGGVLPRVAAGFGVVRQAGVNVCLPNRPPATGGSSHTPSRTDHANKRWRRRRSGSDTAHAAPGADDGHTAQRPRNRPAHRVPGGVGPFDSRILIAPASYRDLVARLQEMYNSLSR